MAGNIPIVAKILKKLIITVTTATVPKSLGVINLANTADTIKDTIIPEYLSIADQNTPCIISCLTDDITYILINEEHLIQYKYF